MAAASRASAPVPPAARGPSAAFVVAAVNALSLGSVAVEPEAAPAEAAGALPEIAGVLPTPSAPRPPLPVVAGTWYPVIRVPVGGPLAVAGTGVIAEVLAVRAALVASSAVPRTPLSKA